MASTQPTTTRDITAQEARVGDVWQSGGSQTVIDEIGDGPTTAYIDPSGAEVTGPLVRLKGRIISGRDRGFTGYWNVQPLQPMEVKRD